MGGTGESHPVSHKRAELSQAGGLFLLQLVRLLPAASSSAWGEGAACLLQQSWLAQPARAVLGHTGPAAPLSCRASSASHRPALRAGIGCYSSPACGLLGQDTSSSETSQAHLGSPMSACAEEMWRWPQGEEALSHTAGSRAGSHSPRLRKTKQSTWNSQVFGVH